MKYAWQAYFMPENLRLSESAVHRELKPGAGLSGLLGHWGIMSVHSRSMLDCSRDGSRPMLDHWEIEADLFDAALRRCGNDNK
mmetsp:Transcript_10124/g.30529  ORF Transcript_10124/g.30529 Transcript_10124/m.30529 type:complete len:83 (-) Transcript_10124:1260-1508(-)